MGEIIKKYGGQILLGFVALATLIAFALIFWFMRALVPPDQGGLPLLAIGGVVVLVLLLTTVAIVYSILGLANSAQAMGLPEGSIRAVIALSLIVLFAILSVFLYQGISTGSPVVSIANISEAERSQFLRDHPTARDIQSVIVKDKDGQPVQPKDANGKPQANADGTPKYLYDLSYRSSNAASDDFAKQLLVLLGTLMTAITSFYLGAGTVTSAVKGDKAAQAEGAKLAPKVNDIKPADHTKGTNNDVVTLEIGGTNLDDVGGVKIVRNGAAPIVATAFKKTSTKITCSLDVSPVTTPPASSWDVVLDVDGKDVETKRQLTIK